jgi:RimJ/RimL family protein N-acetyltransferase
MPSEAEIQLRRATHNDRFLIRRWLSEPEIQRWWGGTAAAEAAITLALQSAHALPRVVEFSGSPIGYAHAIEIGTWGEQRLEQFPAGSWQVDFLIGAAEHRNRQVGAAVLELISAEVFATTLAVACCGVVSIRNEASARSYEQAGFRWLRIWPDRVLGPCWLMEKKR